MSTTIVLDSLKALYNDNPDVLKLLNQLDLSSLEDEFYEKLYQHIDKDLFEEVDKFLRSPEVRKYHDAVSLATYDLIDKLGDVAKLLETKRTDNKLEIN